MLKWLVLMENPDIQVKVADGINKAEELINEALSGNAPIYIQIMHQQQLKVKVMKVLVVKSINI